MPPWILLALHDLLLLSSAVITVVTLSQVAVHFMGSVAEALLQLPEVPLRGSVGGDVDAPAALWLTVGLLAADGFALQLKLRKSDKVSQKVVRSC